MAQHHGIRYPCKTCGKPFGKMTVKAHEKKCGGGGKISCDVCGETVAESHLTGQYPGVVGKVGLRKVWGVYCAIFIIVFYSALETGS